MSHKNATNPKEFPLWTALVTPFDSQGNIDWVSLKKLIHEQIEARNGVLLLGSTGEALNMSLSEKKSLLEFSMPFLKDSPVMVGLGGFNESENLDWLNYLETLPVDAYLAITPIYAKPGRHGQTKWFEKILNLSSKPVMLYNVPSRSGVKLHPDTVSDLNTHKNFWSIKEASGSVEDMKVYKSRCKGQFVYCGDDGLTPEFCKAGAVGLVSVASNAWPKAVNLFTKMSAAGELKGADQNAWSEAADSLFIASNPVPVKALLHSEGVISTPTMRAPLCEQDMPSLEPVKKASRFVNEWHKSHC